MTTKGSMQIIFLGTGTSQGIPVIGCECAVCASTDAKDFRLRTSLFFSVRGVDFVIDTGPDFRRQMLDNAIANVDAVLQTHEHKDHLAGLDDIRPYNFLKKKAIDVFAEKRVIASIRREFSYVFKKEKYPGIPIMNVHPISNKAFEYQSIPIVPIRVKHWNLPILGFRVFDFAYITDASSISLPELKKLKNLDVLVINALRHEKHYSHFNLDEALQMIQMLQPKRAYLTHISHTMGFYHDVQNMLPPNVFVAHDGMRISIP